MWPRRERGNFCLTVPNCRHRLLARPNRNPRPSTKPIPNTVISVPSPATPAGATTCRPAAPEKISVGLSNLTLALGGAPVSNNSRVLSLNGGLTLVRISMVSQSAATAEDGLSCWKALTRGIELATRGSVPRTWRGSKKSGWPLGESFLVGGGGNQNRFSPGTTRIGTLYVM